MALFDKMNNYKKEGKGIDKNAPQKNVFFKYFEIFFSKFFSLVKTNVCFDVVFVPVAVMVVFLFKYVYPLDFGSGAAAYFKYFLILLPTVLLGPVTIGITKVTRDFAREVPGFPIEDFKNTSVKNIGRGLITSLLGYVFSFVVIVACIWYRGYFSYSWMFKIGYYVALFVAAVSLFAFYYVPIMMVTTDLSLKNILKNAYLLAFICLPKNIILTLTYLVFTGIAIALFVFGNTVGAAAFCLPVLVIYLLFLYFSAMSFSNSYIIFPAVKKYIIDPYYLDNPEETAEAVVNPGKVFKNIGEEIEKKEVPEYVYENGKLVHRSVLENVMDYNDEKPNYDNEEE